MFFDRVLYQCKAMEVIFTLETMIPLSISSSAHSWQVRRSAED
jgi:hypothetical protein